MSVLSLKRVILFVATALLALPLFATNPTPRLAPRMAFDEKSGVAIMFGGRGLTDPATGLEHANDETWMWVRNQWVQLFPTNRPGARSAHSMVYHPLTETIYIFGGRKEGTVVRQKFSIYDDTWAWKDGNWSDVAPEHSPEERYFAGITFDADRGKVMLYGGFNYTADGKDFEALQDTWEFDGVDWTRIAENGPLVSKPLLVFDAVRHKTLMLGTNEDGEVEMYGWNADASRWDSVAATELPPCVNESQLVYQVHNQRPMLTGGLCSDSSGSEEVYEWDGATWSEVELVARSGSPLREVDSAAAYDPVAQHTIRFGGHSSIQSTPDSTTAIYRNRIWRFSVATSGRPDPRSAGLFRRDAERGVVWLFGGLDETSYGTTSASYLSDLWTYSAGAWNYVEPTDVSDTPFGCVAPIGAWDTDRKVLVVVCEGNTPYEWDGAAWKTFEDVDPFPNSRRFAGGVYDQTLKKFVMFGGYDSFGNYRQDTWTWNGTKWEEIKPDEKPQRRAQPVMWYDPLAKKTILYSGAGAKSIDHHAERFQDMWSFDGTKWTRLSETAAPGIRFAPQIAIDPTTGKVLMFGGLRATIDEEDKVTQFYANDLWLWDGGSSSWTKIETENAPSPRQNGAFDYDPATGKFVLFGGFAGNLYLSDRWLWDGQTWTVVPESPIFKSRSTRH